MALLQAPVLGNPPLLGVVSLQFQTEAGARRVRMQASSSRRRGTIEHHVLDSRVVMEVLHMRNRWRCATYVRVNRWRRMRGKWRRVRER
jgi:hypothetical protein